MVARPATSDAVMRRITSRTPHKASRAPRDVSAPAAAQGIPRSYAAISASVAANDIWKLGCTTASGTSSITANAATAMVRMVSVARSTITPTSTTAAMI